MTNTYKVRSAAESTITTYNNRVPIPLSLELVKKMPGVRDDAEPLAGLPSAMRQLDSDMPKTAEKFIRSRADRNDPEPTEYVIA